MPLIIPKEMPAFDLLQDLCFVMDKRRANTQDIRPLELLIVNLMPIKIQTESQILSLIGNSPLQVNITFFATTSYVGKNTPKTHLDKFYLGFDDISGRNFDGAIVTGAPIEHLEFEEVKYWDELICVMEHLRAHCTSTLYLCWGAMAGLYYFHKIQKIGLKEKLFGIFEHNLQNDDVLLNGLDDVVLMPHSRHSGVNQDQIRKNSELKILLEGQESGITMLKDNKDVFILGHPEYTRNTLNEEYERDLQKGLKIKKPSSYFNTKGEPVFSWRSSASVIFQNWLNFSVYQATPFDLANHS